jgi:hypothetical protein
MHLISLKCNSSIAPSKEHRQIGRGATHSLVTVRCNPSKIPDPSTRCGPFHWPFAYSGLFGTGPLVGRDRMHPRLAACRRASHGLGHAPAGLMRDKPPELSDRIDRVTRVTSVGDIHTSAACAQKTHWAGRWREQPSGHGRLRTAPTPLSPTGLSRQARGWRLQVTV